MSRWERPVARVIPAFLVRRSKEGKVMRNARQVAAAALGIAIGCSLASPSVFAGSGDAAAGQRVFARCAGCHSVRPGVNGAGPSLAGVFGRASGTAPGYNYSPALKSANVTWDETTLDKYLQAPGNFVHGTKMFVNLPGSKDRADVIAYLETLSASPNQSSGRDK
jgi:cytochrome c